MNFNANDFGATGVAKVIAEFERPLVFGMPGGHTINIYDALHGMQDRVECVLVREESIGTVMAEAYGRIAHTPAVVMAQGAWVLGAGGIGVMEAHLGASPAVILIDATEGGSFSHHGPYQSGFGGYGAYDLAQAMDAISKRVFVAIDPVQAVQMTQLAYKHAMTGQPGPVTVVFHSAALLAPLGEDGVERLHATKGYAPINPTPSEESIAEAATVLAKASNPVIIAGNGARSEKSRAALAAFARAHGIPVVTTSSGKGVFNEESSLAGGTMGSHGQDSANELVARADVIIAIATKLGSSDLLNERKDLVDAGRQAIVQIDIEPLNIGWTQPVATGILGDASAALPMLSKALGDKNFEGETHVLASGGLYNEINIEDWKDRERVHPRRLARILSEVLPSHTTVTCDAGENRIYMLHDFQVREGMDLLQPNGGGGMGYAIQASLAVNFADPGRLPVAVTGDGGFAMSLHALMTAVESQRTLIAVLMDNQMLGWVKHGQGDRPLLSDFHPFDHAAIAFAIGCNVESARSEDEVRSGLEALLSAGGVGVLVVHTDPNVSFKSVETKMASKGHEEVETYEDVEVH